MQLNEIDMRNSAEQPYSQLTPIQMREERTDSPLHPEQEQRLIDQFTPFPKFQKLT